MAAATKKKKDFSSVLHTRSCLPMKHIPQSIWADPLSEPQWAEFLMNSHNNVRCILHVVVHPSVDTFSRQRCLSSFHALHRLDQLKRMTWEYLANILMLSSLKDDRSQRNRLQFRILEDPWALHTPTSPRLWWLVQLESSIQPKCIYLLHSYMRTKTNETKLTVSETQHNVSRSYSSNQ